MASDQTSARLPWASLALSFLSPGVGHIYCGRLAKGLALYLVRFLLPVLSIVAAFLTPSDGVLIALILLPAAATLGIYLYAAVDSYVIARGADAEYELKECNRAGLYSLLIVIQLAYPVALTWGIREYVYEAFVIPTRSMSPTFLAGDRILVNKRPFRDDFPRRGDLVVFRAPSSDEGRIWVKRVIGIAGDRIVVRGHGIEVNGERLEREQVGQENAPRLGQEVTGIAHHESNAGRRYHVLLADDGGNESADEIVVNVPERSVFVMGDNRDRSRDSRQIGSIHVGDVIGFVDYIFLPAEDWSRFGTCRN